MTYEEQYLQLVKKVMEEGDLEYNQRTNCKTKRIIGTMISCDLRKEIPLLSIRKMYPKTGAAELAWMLMGTQEGGWLKKYSKIWEKFEEDGLLKSAYGYRWRRHFGRDQILQCVDLLKKDPSTRQAVVFAWDPGLDGLKNSGKAKNIPCHMGFSAYVVNGRLDLCVYQRSLDTIVGLPYDILLYGLLNMAMANSLEVEKGRVSIAFGDTHIYDCHFDIANFLIEKNLSLIVSQEINKDTYLAHNFNLTDIYRFPDEYVENVVKSLSFFKYSDYAPIPEVVL